MRRLAMCVPMIILLLLTACGGGVGEAAEELALDTRAYYLAMADCTAQLEVVADYGQRVYGYTLDLSYDRGGDTTITVVAPENIAGVTARLRPEGTALEYDGVRVETGALSPDGMSPVDAVPALLTCAREGFIAECGMEELNGVQTLRIYSRTPDAVVGQGREISLWFDPESHHLLRGEISQDGYTVIQCEFTQFQMSTVN